MAPYCLVPVESDPQGPKDGGYRQNYKVWMVRKGPGGLMKREELTTGLNLFAVPSNVGPRTMPSYPALAAQGYALLRKYCYRCHGVRFEVPGYNVLDRDILVARRKEGEWPYVVPGKPEESLLLDRIRDGEMPPGDKKVPPAQVAVIERWIAEGARTLRDEPEGLPPGIVLEFGSSGPGQQILEGNGATATPTYTFQGGNGYSLKTETEALSGMARAFFSSPTALSPR